VTTTHSPRPPARATRFVLATIASAALAAGLLTGCGSAPDGPVRPAAARSVSDPAGATAAGPSAQAELSEAPTSTGSATPASAGTTPSAAPAADLDQSLAGIDRALADLDHQLTDADHDVATPEGDIR